MNAKTRLETADTSTIDAGKENRDMKRRQKRTITNESGKQITMMIDPADTNQHIYSRVEWNVSESQWKRICRASDGNNTTWRTERGAVIEFHCPPQKKRA